MPVIGSGEQQEPVNELVGADDFFQRERFDQIIARIPRDDNRLGGVCAGGDQSVGNFDADQPPNLNRPLHHRVGNGNFFNPGASASITIPLGANLALPGAAVQVGPVKNTQGRLDGVPVGMMGRFRQQRDQGAPPLRQAGAFRRNDSAARDLSLYRHVCHANIMPPNSVQIKRGCARWFSGA